MTITADNGYQEAATNKDESATNKNEQASKARWTNEVTIPAPPPTLHDIQQNSDIEKDQGTAQTTTTETRTTQADNQNNATTDTNQPQHPTWMEETTVEEQQHTRDNQDQEQEEEDIEDVTPLITKLDIRTVNINPGITLEDSQDDGQRPTYDSR